MAPLGRIHLTILLVFIILAGPPCSLSAQVQPIDEYRVKAVFLLNFARFVEWPVQAFKTAHEPIGICVLGENPFDSALREAVRGKTAATRTLALRQIYTAKEASGCHILFMAASTRKGARAVLAELKGHSILTVGEAEDFIAAGGLVRFKLKGASVRFEIDADAAARANLRISSKLLSLAEISGR
jgi:hypothetical protein